MPNYETALPVDATAINPELTTINREGADGTEKIVQIFGGDKFVGEVLSRNWLKKNDGNILGPHTQLISGGELQLYGKSHSAGTADECWIYSESILPLRSGLVLDVHMKLASLASADVYGIAFCLSPVQPLTVTPSLLDDVFYVELFATSTLYWIRVAKEVGGVFTNILATGVDNGEGTFRIKLSSVSGLVYVYFHDGVGDVDESEDEIGDSPFNLSLGWNLAYPSFELQTTDATAYTVVSESIIVNYPDNALELLYQIGNAGRLLGRCRIFDNNNSDTESEWTEIFDPDHTFTGECIIQNGLIRYKINQATQYGIEPLFYTGSAWASDYGEISFDGSSSGGLDYAFFTRIVDLSPDLVTVEVLYRDSASEDDDHYIRVWLTVRRGSLSGQFMPKEVYPLQTFSFIYNSNERIGIAGDAETHNIGDLYLTQTEDNTTLSDNWMAQFEPQ